MFLALNLKVSYGKKEIIRDVSFDLGRGEIIGLMGLNGSGKSTLLKGIVGLLPLEFGRIWFNGLDVTNYSLMKRTKFGITYVAQNKNYFESLSVKESLFLACHHARDRKKRLEEVFEFVLDIVPDIHKRVGLLSGGQRQKVAVAMGLMMRPKILLLDEPTASLDEESAVRFISQLRKWVSQGERSILLVSHQEAVIRQGDGALFMKNGQMVEAGGG